MIQQLIRNRKGQGMVEYGLIVAGVALIAIVGVSVLGHKTEDMIGTAAAILPGAHTDDNAAIQSGKLVETTGGTSTTPITVDGTAVLAHSGASRLDGNVGVGGDATADSTLVTEAPDYTGK